MIAIIMVYLLLMFLSVYVLHIHENIVNFLYVKQDYHPLVLMMSAFDQLKYNYEHFPMIVIIF